MQDQVGQESRVYILFENEDVISTYAKDVVVDINAQISSATSSSMAAIEEVSQDAPHDPTAKNIYFAE